VVINVCCISPTGIEFTGGIPYSIMKPILDGVSAAQLYQFEHFNPYILEDTDHLWKFHVSKEFRAEKRQEMETWREMYLVSTVLYCTVVVTCVTTCLFVCVQRCLDEREEKYKAVTANIQKTIKQSLPVRTTKLAYVDNPKPPRNILRKQVEIYIKSSLLSPPPIVSNYG
jgi:transcription elongation factor B polypeptide 3